MKLIVEYATLQRDSLIAWLTVRLPLTAKPLYRIDETLENPDFHAIADPPAALSGLDPATTLAGRIFGPGAELKWLAHDGGLDVWSTREAEDSAAEPEGLHVVRHLRAVETKYYCLGTWNPDAGCYLEGNIARDLQYPIDGSRKDNRFFVKVAEYFAVPPLGPQTLEQVIAGLNRPRILAARLVGVCEGRDEWNVR